MANMLAVSGLLPLLLAAACAFDIPRIVPHVKTNFQHGSWGQDVVFRGERAGGASNLKAATAAAAWHQEDDSTTRKRAEQKDDGASLESLVAPFLDGDFEITAS